MRAMGKSIANPTNDTVTTIRRIPGAANPWVATTVAAAILRCAACPSPALREFEDRAPHRVADQERGSDQQYCGKTGPGLKKLKMVPRFASIVPAISTTNATLDAVLKVG